jgi:hypothetical protein
MKESMRTNWVAALRSGRYSQGKSCLRSQDGKHCCLGVLGVLHASRTTGVHYTLSPPETLYRYHDETRTFSSRNYLPSTFLNTKAQDKLSTMNDDGDSFEAIAYVIEAMTLYELSGQIHARIGE